MAKQYFKTITTSVFQDQFEDGAREHNEKLNNYLNVDAALGNDQYEKLGDQFKNYTPPNRKVDYPSTNTLWLHQTVKFITVLCCHDEEIEEENK